MKTVPFRHPPQVIPSSSQTLKQQEISQHEKPPKQYPSYLDAVELSPRARTFCEILAKAPKEEVESALSATGVNPDPEVVEAVLKLSYGSPAAAVAFFRWVGLKRKPSPLTWNLIVDLLGKNKMFDPMWDAIRSMKQEGVLSVTTFVSVFESYCVVGRFDEAIMTFNVMEKHGIKPDVVAVNSLLSAICREDFETGKAMEFFEKIRNKVPPDGDSYAILLEGWEKEGNVSKAKTTFGDMVVRIGWSPENMSAYDAFLNTLVQGSQVDEALKFLYVMKGKKCLPGLKFFINALDVLIKRNDSAHAIPLWDMMMRSGLIPDLTVHNSMIGLLCDNNATDNAFQVLDEMPYKGLFPDSLSYNIIFQCLIKNKKVHEAGSFFFEMIKNEQAPTPENCAAAISMFFDGYDPEMADEVWSYMKKDNISPLDDSGNALLNGLANMGRTNELRRHFDSMLNRRIKIYQSTMDNLKIAFQKEGRNGCDTYEELFRNWKSS